MGCTPRAPAVPKATRNGSEYQSVYAFVLVCVRGCGCVCINVYMKVHVHYYYLKAYVHYYYYESDNIKIDVKFEKETVNETETIKKIVSTYEIKAYPLDIASKIKERMGWKKFGMAVNDKKNEHNNTVDDVNFDIHC